MKGTTMRILLLVAFILAIFAVIVATGTAFVTGWNVWLCGAVAAYFLDLLLGDRLVISGGTRVVRTP